MKLDLSEIARTPGMRYRYNINEPCIEEEGIACTEPIRGVIDFANTGRAIIATGSFETTVQLECSRCLTNFAIPVSSEIDEHFLIPDPEEETAVVEDEDELKLEEEQEPLFSENVLDLTELLRQDLIVAIPIRPLCEDACKGLCATCGVNLNEAECKCDRTATSSAFANLAEMWEKRQGDSEEQIEAN